MPELIIERLNNLWRVDNPNKIKKPKNSDRVTALLEQNVINDKVNLLQHQRDDVEVEDVDEGNFPDANLRGAEYVQVPNVHDPPEKEVQSDLVSKYDDSSNRYAVLVEDV